MVELKPHQQEALKKLDNGKILCGRTGVGKSITAAAYYIEKEAPKDVYVITTAKKRDSLDWHKEFIRFGVSRGPDATLHGVLTVDSWNNIGKYEGVEGAFFIFDEQRLVGSGAWTKSFDKIAKKNNWILLSATPGDTWLDYIPVFVANGFYKNRTQFKQEHVVYNHHAKYPKVDQYLAVSKLVRLRNELLVDMPFEMHTTRHIHKIKVNYDEDLFKKVWKDRWHVYENRPLRDVAELFSVARKVVNSDSARIEALTGLLKLHPRMIVFYNFDYELEMLRSLLTTQALDPSHTTRESSVETGGSSDTWTTPESTELLSSPASTSTSTKSDSSEKSDSKQCSTLSSLSSIDSSSHKTSSEPASSADVMNVGPTASPTFPRSNESCQKKISGPMDSPEGSRTSQQKSESSSTKNLTSECDDSTRRPTSGKASDQSHGEIQSDESQTFEKTSTESPLTSNQSNSQSQNESSRNSQPFSTSSLGSEIESDTGSNTFAIAEWNGHKHEPIPETDRWVYLVQYAAGSEGWNCVTTDTVVFFSLTYSWKMFHQAHGRIDRLNTPFTDLHYYVLMSDSLIDRAVWTSLLKKKSFNEKALGVKFD